MPGKDLLPYIVAQILGAIIAATVIFVIKDYDASGGLLQMAMVIYHLTDMVYDLHL